MATPAVQFTRVGIANRNQQWWHDPAETARPPPNRHESAETTKTSRDSRSSQLYLSQGRCKTKKCYWASYTSLCHCPLSPIYTPSKHHVSSMGLASPQVLTQHVSLLVKLQVSLSQLISLCQSGPHSAEVARSCSITQKVFCLFVWWVSLYGVPTNAAQLHNVRWTNTCVSLAKNLYMSFHVFALAKHPFTCVHFRKTLLHVFAPANHHPT